MSDEQQDTQLPYSDHARHEMTEQKSLWKRYSLGIAANNKVVDSKTLYVTPIEAVSMQDGELISNPFHQAAEGWDAKDELYRTNVKTDTAIECIWKGDTNRRTAPDVRRGERCWIWRYADRDEFYWTSAGLDDHLRKLETVVFGISGTPDEEQDGTLLDHGYHMEFSSHKGRITIQTSAKNGEYCTYAIQINAKDGMMTFSDNLGNNVHINSKTTVVEMENAEGTLVQLNMMDIFMKAKNNIEAKAENNIKFEAGNNFDMKAGGKMTLKASEIEVDGETKFKSEVTMDAKLTATGIESSAPIVGPSDTI